jgi:uncharacterized protein YoxC
MSDEVFRIIITIAVGLATIAFLVQAGVVIALYGAVRKMQSKVEPLVDRAHPILAKIEPIVEKASPIVDRIGPVVDDVKRMVGTAHGILEDARPRVAEISGEVLAITHEGRRQVERIGVLLNDAGDRARTRLEQIDHTVETTVDQVEHVGDSVKRAVMRPVREVNGLAAGISAAVATLVKGRKSSVDAATQDEEMFI